LETRVKLIERRSSRLHAAESSRTIPAIVLRATQLMTCPLVLPAAVFVAPDSPFRDGLVENAGLIVGGLLVPFFASTALLDSGVNGSRPER
jgi:hypothetical protein